MITINLVPHARRRQQVQLTHEDRMLMFVVLAVLLVLAATYGYARWTVIRTSNHLADLNAQITALASEQKLLDLNRSLAKRSLAMESNIGAAVKLQIDTNRMLDDLAKDLPKACLLTQANLTVLTGTIDISASSAQFVDLVRFFNALSADVKFKNVKITGYQVPYATGAVTQGLQPQATMNLTVTWVGGSNG